MIKKEKFKKALSLFLAFVLMLGIVMPTVSEVAEAKTYYVKHTPIEGSELFGSTGWGYGNKVLIGKNNPKIGFCLEPGVAGADKYHNVIKPSDIGISETKMNELALIAWYGYRGNPKVNKDTKDLYYCLTQSLIWKELGSKRRLGYSSKKTGNYTTNNSMKPFFKKTIDKVNSFYDKPSFNKKTYIINEGYTKSIKDSKGVLSELKIKSVTGGKATISGNTLKVTPDGKSNKMQIIFDRGMSAAQTKTNFVLDYPGAQAVSILTGQDPYKAFINIKVNLNGKAQVTKKSESGKYIKGAKFNIKNASGSVNKNATTDGTKGFLFV